MTPNDVKIVADNIDDFIEIPGGVIELRKTLLTLAVSGLLVPQKRTEHNSLSEGIIDSELPYPVPSTWRWVRLDSISDIEYGTRIVKGRNVSGTYYVYGGGGKTFTTNTFNRSDSVIISRFGMSPYCVRKIHGKFFLNDSGLTVSTKDKNTLLQAYLDYVFFAFEQQIYLFGRGAAQKNLYVDDFRKMPVPVPPLSEQKRIVTELEKVLPLIPELEAKKQERDEVRTRLARSAMQSLGKGESKIAFEQLTELVKTPSDIKELESALLTLAVSGKLTQQNKSDGTSEDLFNQIQSKRVKVKKQVPVGEKDQLFPIPSSWSWVRLEDVFDVRDGTHDSPKYHDNGYPLITSKNLYYGTLDFLNVKYISEADHKKISERSRVDRDDVLFAMIGSIGNPVIVDTDTEFSIKNVALFKYYDRKLSEPVFLLTYLKYATQNMRAVSAGGVQSFVSLGFLRQYPFPLPPLPEQKRIVKKVEEVTALINRLKKVMEI